MVETETGGTSAPYCLGARCEDCTPDDECCEGSCGCCPRVTAQDWCWIRPGSEDGSRYCSQHGERWLNDMTRESELRWLNYEMSLIAARAGHGDTAPAHPGPGSST